MRAHEEEQGLNTSSSAGSMSELGYSYPRTKLLKVWGLPYLGHLVVFIVLFLLSLSFLIYSQIQKNQTFEEKVAAQEREYQLLSKYKLAASTLTPRGHYAKRSLCKMLKDENCKSYFIADSIDLLWVIAPIYRFHAQKDYMYLKTHLEFIANMESYGLQVVNIEAIRFPNVPENERGRSKEAHDYAVTKPGNEPYDIQLYYYNVSYIRENLLNVALRKLDNLKPWEYAVWIDGHQFFDNHYWWEETIYKTEKIKSLQLFGLLDKLDERNKSIVTYYSILRESMFTSQIDIYSVVYGNAYGITKDVYKQIDFIYDECIATSCDCAYSLASFPDNVGWNLYWAPDYYRNFDTWINKTKKVFKTSRGYVRGNLYHLHHGKMFPYFELQTAVEEFGFNATRDIKRDSNFSLYIANEKVSAVMEWIVWDSKDKA